ncbi:UNVERIFIED_CONTAM: hypothetical protein FKN15_069833 [Acipenser sinensis]
MHCAYRSRVCPIPCLGEVTNALCLPFQSLSYPLSGRGYECTVLTVPESVLSPVWERLRMHCAYRSRVCPIPCLGEVTNALCLPFQSLSYPLSGRGYECTVLTVPESVLSPVWERLRMHCAYRSRVCPIPCLGEVTNALCLPFQSLSYPLSGRGYECTVLTVPESVLSPVWERLRMHCAYRSRVCPIPCLGEVTNALCLPFQSLSYPLSGRGYECTVLTVPESVLSPVWERLRMHCAYRSRVCPIPCLGEVTNALCLPFQSLSYPLSGRGYECTVLTVPESVLSPVWERLRMHCAYRSRVCPIPCLGEVTNALCLPFQSLSYPLSGRGYECTVLTVPESVLSPVWERLRMHCAYRSRVCPIPCLGEVTNALCLPFQSLSYPLSGRACECTVLTVPESVPSPVWERLRMHCAYRSRVCPIPCLGEVTNALCLPFQSLSYPLSGRGYECTVLTVPESVLSPVWERLRMHCAYRSRVCPIPCLGEVTNALCLPFQSLSYPLSGRGYECTVLTVPESVLSPVWERLRMHCAYRSRVCPIPCLGEVTNALCLPFQSLSYPLSGRGYECTVLTVPESVLSPVWERLRMHCAYRSRVCPIPCLGEVTNALCLPFQSLSYPLSGRGYECTVLTVPESVLSPVWERLRMHCAYRSRVCPIPCLGEVTNALCLPFQSLSYPLSGRGYECTVLTVPESVLSPVWERLRMHCAYRSRVCPIPCLGEVTNALCLPFQSLSYPLSGRGYECTVLTVPESVLSPVWERLRMHCAYRSRVCPIPCLGEVTNALCLPFQSLSYPLSGRGYECTVLTVPESVLSPVWERLRMHCAYRSRVCPIPCLGEVTNALCLPFQSLSYPLSGRGYECTVLTVPESVLSPVWERLRMHCAYRSRVCPIPCLGEVTNALCLPFQSLSYPLSGRGYECTVLTVPESVLSPVWERLRMHCAYRSRVCPIPCLGEVTNALCLPFQSLSYPLSGRGYECTVLTVPESVLSPVWERLRMHCAYRSRVCPIPCLGEVTNALCLPFQSLSYPLSGRGYECTVLTVPESVLSPVWERLRMHCAYRSRVCPIPCLGEVTNALCLPFQSLSYPLSGRGYECTVLTVPESVLSPVWERLRMHCAYRSRVCPIPCLGEVTNALCLPFQSLSYPLSGRGYECTVLTVPESVLSPVWERLRMHCAYRSRVCPIPCLGEVTNALCLPFQSLSYPLSGRGYECTVLTVPESVLSPVWERLRMHCAYRSRVCPIPCLGEVTNALCLPFQSLSYPLSGRGYECTVLTVPESVLSPVWERLRMHCAYRSRVCPIPCLGEVTNALCLPFQSLSYPLSGRGYECTVLTVPESVLSPVWERLRMHCAYRSRVCPIPCLGEVTNALCLPFQSLSYPLSGRGYECTVLTVPESVLSPVWERLRMHCAYRSRVCPIPCLGEVTNALCLPFQSLSYPLSGRGYECTVLTVPESVLSPVWERLRMHCAYRSRVCPIPCLGEVTNALCLPFQSLSYPLSGRGYECTVLTVPESVLSPVWERLRMHCAYRSRVCPIPCLGEVTNALCLPFQSLSYPLSGRGYECTVLTVPESVLSPVWERLRMHCAYRSRVCPIPCLGEVTNALCLPFQSLSYPLSGRGYECTVLTVPESVLSPVWERLRMHCAYRSRVCPIPCLGEVTNALCLPFQSLSYPLSGRGYECTVLTVPESVLSPVWERLRMHCAYRSRVCPIPCLGEVTNALCLPFQSLSYPLSGRGYECTVLTVPESVLSPVWERLRMHCAYRSRVCPIPCLGEVTNALCLPFQSLSYPLSGRGYECTVLTVPESVLSPVWERLRMHCAYRSRVCPIPCLGEVTNALCLPFQSLSYPLSGRGYECTVLTVPESVLSPVWERLRMHCAYRSRVCPIPCLGEVTNALCLPFQSLSYPLSGRGYECTVLTVPESVLSPVWERLRMHCAYRSRVCPIPCLGEVTNALCLPFQSLSYPLSGRGYECTVLTVPESVLSPVWERLRMHCAYRSRVCPIPCLGEVTNALCLPFQSLSYPLSGRGYECTVLTVPESVLSPVSERLRMHCAYRSRVCPIHCLGEVTNALCLPFQSLSYPLSGRGYECTVLTVPESVLSPVWERLRMHCAYRSRVCPIPCLGEVTNALCLPFQSLSYPLSGRGYECTVLTVPESVLSPVWERLRMHCAYRSRVCPIPCLGEVTNALCLPFQSLSYPLSGRGYECTVLTVPESVLSPVWERLRMHCAYRSRVCPIPCLGEVTNALCLPFQSLSYPLSGRGYECTVLTVPESVLSPVWERLRMHCAYRSRVCPIPCLGEVTNALCLPFQSLSYPLSRRGYGCTVLTVPESVLSPVWERLRMLCAYRSRVCPIPCLGEVTDALCLPFQSLSYPLSGRGSECTVLTVPESVLSPVSERLRMHCAYLSRVCPIPCLGEVANALCLPFQSLSYPLSRRGYGCTVLTFPESVLSPVWER